MMNNSNIQHGATWVLAACLLLPSTLVAQQTSSSTTKPNARKSPDAKSLQRARQFANSYAEYTRLRKKYDDPAFDRYVNLAQLGKAWDTLDSTLLTDVALQLAYAEDILQRSHKKITADTAFDVAIRLASEKRDAAALTRLAKAAQHYGKADVLARIETTEKLASTSRAVGEELMSSPFELSPVQYSRLHAAIEWLTRIRISSDIRLVDALESSRLMVLLTPDQQQYVQQQIDELRSTLMSDAGDETISDPVTTPADEANAADQPSASSQANIGEMLKTLSAASRAYDASLRHKPRHPVKPGSTIGPSRAYDASQRTIKQSMGKDR